MQRKHPMDVASPAFIQQDYAHYRWMRAEAPVYRGRYGRLFNAYMLSRYADVSATLKDPRLVRDRRNALPGASRLPIWLPKSLQALTRSMIVSDEPDHRRLRTLVHKAFTPRVVAGLAQRIEALTHELLDAAERAGTTDLVTAYALPIPMTVIAELIGVPRDDRPRFLAWSQRAVGVPSALGFVGWYRALRATMGYIEGLIAERRRNPQDDLLTALVQAEEAGDQLDKEELLSLVFLLLIAGYETTVNLIANGTRVLLDHPEQLAALRAEPALIEGAIEEIVRYDGPVQATKPCYPSEDLTLHGVTIPRGAMVMLLLGAANRDEAAFPDPDRFDIRRTPNRHLGYGHGIHYCLGAPLARLEGSIALTTLIGRYPNLRLAVAPERLRYKAMPLFHRLETLPVRFG
ncbi:MAG TPA: cytochrome P450 [Roseiflexaceae bacterium]|nr:cytochrome P450 [Roseiflexaceae bacterium]